MTTIWVCSDCLIYLANNDLTGMDYMEESADRIKAVKDGVTALGMACCGTSEHCMEHSDPDDHDEHSENCETKDFSRSSCESCHSPLGGSRYAVTVDSLSN